MDTTENTKPLQKISNLSQLHFVRQLVLMGGLAASIALGVAVVLWSSTPDFKLLYAGLSSQDSAKITATLEQNGLEYRIDQRSGDITVPASEVHSTRLVLARSGLPPKATKGFSILDQKQALGTSNFIERARYNRALQEELVETIESMESIREARVHLSIPKQTSFLRSHLKPSASIMLNLYPGTSLNDMQVAGIKHLISASTPGLDTDLVSIVDQKGSLLSADKDSEFSTNSSNLRLKRQVEEDYAERIVKILTPIVGMNRVHAQVSAELDFSTVETTREVYEPETVLRSEQSDTEETKLEREPAGVPGLLPNDPNANLGQLPEEADARTVRAKNRSTRNYEVDRSISHSRRAPGSIGRISVAVLIDYPDKVISESAEAAGAGGAEDADTPSEPESALEPEQHARLVSLVKQTIGFSEQRGDVVSIIDSDFIPQELHEQFEEPGLLDQPAFWSALRQGGAGLVILLIIFGVLRPVLRSSVATENSLPMRATPGTLAYAGAGGDPGAMAEDRVSLSRPTTQGLPQPGNIANYADNLAQAKAIVETEPERAARLIQGWVADDHG
jgi:flagellar M-ring protein FliF